MRKQLERCRDGVNVRQHGTEKVRFSMHPQYSPFERLLSRFAVSDGCWIWTASLDGKGYGQIGFGSWRSGTRHSIRAHRLVYELFKGPISDGLELDHLCRTPACVKPAHLEVVTHRENTLRGVGIMAREAQQTHCKRGHPFDLFNTMIRPNGSRKCRKCDRIHHRRWEQRRRGSPECISG